MLIASSSASRLVSTGGIPPRLGSTEGMPARLISIAGIESLLMILIFRARFGGRGLLQLGHALAQSVRSAARHLGQQPAQLMSREAIFRHRTHNHRTKRDAAATAYYRSARSQVQNGSLLKLANLGRCGFLAFGLVLVLLSGMISACGNGSVQKSVPCRRRVVKRALLVRQTPTAA